MTNWHNDTCPRCGGYIASTSARGESGIYQSHDIPSLCEPCFLAEDDEITERGTNNLPDTLQNYRDNIKRLGIR